MNVISKTLTKHSIEQLTSPTSDGGSTDGNVMSPNKKIKTEPMVSYNEMKKMASSEKIVSYTEMIARAIFSCPNNMSTLQDIYNFLSVKYPVLQNRGKSWKNSVRHTLSLNEWFVKIPRMDNGKCCYWSVHPVYLQRFKKGDFQKQRKSNACKLRNAARTLEELQYNLNNPYHMSSYYPTDMSNNYYHSLPSWPVCRTSVDSMQQPYYNISPQASAYPSHIAYAQTSSMNVQNHMDNSMGGMMTAYMKPEKISTPVDMCKPFNDNLSIPCNRSPIPAEPSYNHKTMHDNMRYNSFSPNIQASTMPNEMLSHVPTNELIRLQMQMRMENSM